MVELSIGGWASPSPLAASHAPGSIIGHSTRNQAEASSKLVLARFAMILPKPQNSAQMSPSQRPNPTGTADRRSPKNMESSLLRSALRGPRSIPGPSRTVALWLIPRSPLADELGWSSSSSARDYEHPRHSRGQGRRAPLVLQPFSSDSLSSSRLASASTNQLARSTLR